MDFRLEDSVVNIKNYYSIQLTSCWIQLISCSISLNNYWIELNSLWTELNSRWIETNSRWIEKTSCWIKMTNCWIVTEFNWNLLNSAKKFLNSHKLLNTPQNLPNHHNGCHNLPTENTKNKVEHEKWTQYYKRHKIYPIERWTESIVGLMRIKWKLFFFCFSFTHGKGTKKHRE